MKKLIKLSYFRNNIRNNITGRLMYNLDANTPTLYLAPADSNNYQERNYYRSGIVNCYCRACESLFVAPNAISNAMYGKKITCPNCGHVHYLSNIVIANQSSDTLPRCIKVSLIEMKASIVLKFAYKASVLGENIFKNYNEVKVIEKFIFNFQSKTATWTKSIDDVNKSREIGYLNDLSTPLQSVIQYIPFSVADKYGKKMSEVIALLRNCITKKMLKQNYSKHKLYLRTATADMTERNLLYLARKVRFWDESESEIESIYKENRYECKQRIEQWHLANLDKAEEDISSLLQKGENYISAFLTTFNLPGTQLVKKYLYYSCVNAIRGAYKEETRKFANILLPYFSMNPQKIKVICDYYKYIAKYYPQKHFNDIKDINIVKLKDIINLLKLLSSKNLAKFCSEKPKFKDLHDYLSIMVAEQPANEINYHIPEHIICRLDMELQNSKSKVLTKYSEVLKAGKDLHNCAGSYKNRINENLQLVLITDEIGKAKVLLEIKKQRIIQAKLINNRPVKTDDIYNSLVVDFMRKANLVAVCNDINLPKEVQIKRTA